MIRWEAALVPCCLLLLPSAVSSLDERAGRALFWETSHYLI